MIQPVRVVLYSTLLALTACGERRQCTVPAAFNQAKPGSEAYNAALATELKQLARPRFYLEEYVEQQNEPYLLVLVQQESVCIKALMKVAGTAGMESLLEHKGKGYGGAELYGLKYDIVRDTKGTQIICKSVKRVFD
jgi:hypothetical protein